MTTLTFLFAALITYAIIRVDEVINSLEITTEPEAPVTNTENEISIWTNLPDFRTEFNYAPEEVEETNCWNNLPDYREIFNHSPEEIEYTGWLNSEADRAAFNLAPEEEVVPTTTPEPTPDPKPTTRSRRSTKVTPVTPEVKVDDKIEIEIEIEIENSVRLPEMTMIKPNGKVRSVRMGKKAINALFEDAIRFRNNCIGDKYATSNNVLVNYKNGICELLDGEISEGVFYRSENYVSILDLKVYYSRLYNVAI